ncbi:hypothetical protein BDR06DRAFT_971893 [Suillus hirtellus]|nr:hypothetical protein BDR06DRAFT_971893 [Suillus hirtellus]
MKPRNTALHIGDSNKRKTSDEDSDVVVIADGPKSPPLSRSRQRRKKKFQLTDEDKVWTGTILVKPASDKDLNLAGIDSAADDGNFWEEETRGGSEFLGYNAVGGRGCKPRLLQHYSILTSTLVSAFPSTPDSSWLFFPEDCLTWFFWPCTHKGSLPRGWATTKDVPPRNMLMQPLPTVLTSQPILQPE